MRRNIHRALILILTLPTISCAEEPLALALAPAARAFDGQRAHRHIVEQCSFGPRLPGMPGHRQTRDYISKHLKDLGWKVETQSFRAYYPLMGQTLPFENIIARLNTPSTKTVVLSCHWDTRPVADRDPNPRNRRQPILGANDAGSGVAVLLELATTFKKHPPPVDLLFLFFDAEDGGVGQSENTWCLGSQYLAAHPPQPFDFIVGINLDMVGDDDPVFYLDPNSLITARRWVRDIWDVGHALYPRTFLKEETFPIIDDHLPFVKKKLPYLDIIDLDYPEWHTVNDLPDKCVPESLNRVGKTLAQWMFTRLE